MKECLFCRIIGKEIPAVIVWEDPDIMVWLDPMPLRPGHCQIVPKTHIETFEQMPSELASKVITLGQRLGVRMKEVYQVDRVAFVFTGGGVAHVHAHVVPMHDENDIIFSSDIVNPEDLKFDTSGLRVNREDLIRVRNEMEFKWDGK